MQHADAEFPIGTAVHKARGYAFPGVVVAVFDPTWADGLRYVVECTAPAALGCLHIYSAYQLKQRPEGK